MKSFRLVGIYGLAGAKFLVPRDPKFIKQIMIKDFDYFVNRDANHDLATDPLLSKSVLNLRDQKWKDMRSMLSPIYTTSKMKYMYGLLKECMDDFINFYEEKAKANGNEIEIETHDVYARITADGISTTALGFKGDCVRNKESKIYETADNMETDFTDPIKLTLSFMFPFLFKLFKMQIFRQSIHDFFLTNVLGEIKRRTDGKIVRTDVIQLLVQAKEGQLKLESGDIEELSYTEAKIKKIGNWTDEDLVAQALVFFLGGFETTATLMQVASYELCRNLDVQQKLIEEVDEMVEKLNGQTISYEQLNQMKYLEMVIHETLRMWPSFRATARYCARDYSYKDEETGKVLKVEKGTMIFIPLGIIQMDEKYFPEPEKFDPYRFSDENKSKIQAGTFLPFGMGPRVCIGSRYALLEAKLLLFYVMSRFSIEKTEKTPEKLTHSFGNAGYFEKIYVNLKLRK